MSTTEDASALVDSTLTVQVTYHDDVTRLSAAGEIDASSAHTFEAAAIQALAEQPRLRRGRPHRGRVHRLQRAALDHQLSNRARERQVDVVVTGISAAARRVLEITGLIDTLRRT